MNFFVFIRCGVEDVEKDEFQIRVQVTDTDPITPGVAISEPLTVHITEPVGHDYAGKDSTDTGRLWKFLSSAPSNLKVLLSHWGGGFGFYELMPEVAESLQNVFFDTAASPFLYKPQVYSAGVGLVGIEKVLFGSDYPLMGYSRALAQLAESGLPKPQQHSVLANGLQLLGR